jgi:hypothetical protein
MKQGTTVWSMSLCAGVLLATLTSVYAAHIAAGGGTYTVTSDTIAQFHFTVAARPSQRSPSIPVTTVKVEVKVVHEGDSTSFELFTFSTAIGFFNIETKEEEGIDIDTVTIKGELLSKLVLGEGPDSEHFTESAPFEAVGVDRETPGAGSDSFALTIHYSALQDLGIGPQLKSILPEGFVNCGVEFCTVTFAGTVERGEIVAHSAGGD